MTLTQKVQAVKSEWKKLTRGWTESGNDWQDQVRGEFERDYWADIIHVTPDFISALEDLEQVVQQARRNVH